MTHRDTENTESSQPPDRGAAGDVSTTGHAGSEVERVDTLKTSSSTSGDASHTGVDDHHVKGHDYSELDELDAQLDSHGAHADPHDAHAGHGGHGHGDDASEEPTIVPTTWRQLIFPALILLLVAILVWGPVSGAFQSRPVPATTTTEQHGSEPTAEGSDTETDPTVVTDPEGTPGTEPGTPTAESLAPVATPDPAAVATRTKVEADAAAGTVARAPVQLRLAGREFVVKAGNNLLPDWTPPQDQGIATWIEGTYANHILYLPYSEENEALFREAKAGQKLELVMTTGQVFEFDVTRSERAPNGPSTESTRFTVTTAMAQDHAGVTLFLIGDPAADRAVVQADFNGHIE